MNEREKLLRVEMILYGDNFKSLAEYLGMARQTLVRKIKEGTFNQDEMARIKNRYNLTDEKFAQIFTEGLITNES